MSPCKSSWIVQGQIYIYSTKQDRGDPSESMKLIYQTTAPLLHVRIFCIIEYSVVYGYAFSVWGLNELNKILFLSRHNPPPDLST